MKAERIALPAEFLRPVPWQKWKILAHAAVLCATIPAVAYYAGPVPYIVQPVLAIFAALQYVALFSLMHEACHRHLHPKAHINDRIGEALGMLLATSFHGYRRCHLTHHQKFRTRDDPQEVIFLTQNRTLRAAALVLVGLIGAPFFLLLRAPLTAWQDKRYLAALRGPTVGFLIYASTLLLAPREIAIALLVTLALTILIGSLNDIVYHQGLSSSNTLRACCSLESDLFGQLFLSGANRHAEHHVYIGVPGGRLGRLAPLVRESLQRQGVVYDRGFIAAFFRRLINGPFFLPSD